MKHLSFTFRTTVSFSKPVRDHFFVLRCLPKTDRTQRVDFRLSLVPDISFTQQVDGFGNTIAVGCIKEEHDTIMYSVKGCATVNMAHLPDEAVHPMYYYPSDRTIPSAEMTEFLDGLTLPKDDPQALCTELMYAIGDAMTYAPGSTTVNTTAEEAFKVKRGVCQDYAHIMTALLRTRGIAARYVSGLAVGEGATHAWTEAYIDGHWIGFDPTRNVVCNENYLVMAVGRDWSDCPVERGTFQGNADQTQTVFMRVEER